MVDDLTYLGIAIILGVVIAAILFVRSHNSNDGGF